MFKVKCVLCKKSSVQILSISVKQLRQRESFSVGLSFDLLSVSLSILKF